MTSTDIRIRNRLDRPDVALRAIIFTAFVITAGFRYWYIGFRPLVPDEAYYWVWSLNLQGGYFDHAPGVAWAIAAGTALLGDSERGVRFAHAGLAILTAFTLTLWVARSISWRAAAWATAAILASPLLAGTSSIATPDTPAQAFSILALIAGACAALTRPGSNRAWLWWSAFGAASGLAFLGKYTAILTPASVGLAILLDRRKRQHYATLAFWTCVPVALIVASPVFYWNATHDWESFRFQLGHGLSKSTKGGGLLSFLGYSFGQLGPIGPILAVLVGYATIDSVRHWKKRSSTEHIWTTAAIVPLVFFGVTAWRSHTQVQWPSFAWYPGIALLARWLTRVGRTRRAMQVARFGIAVACALTLLMQFPEILKATGLRLPPNKTDDLIGWKELARDVESKRAGRVVTAGHHLIAACLCFYLPDHPMVFPILPWGRRNHYSLLGGAPDLTKLNSALHVGSGNTYISEEFGPVETSRFEVNRQGVTIRKVKITSATRTLPHGGASKYLKSLAPALDGDLPDENSSN